MAPNVPAPSRLGAFKGGYQVLSTMTKDQVRATPHGPRQLVQSPAVGMGPTQHCSKSRPVGW